MQANAGLAGSLSKHHLDDVDVHFGQASTHAGASIGMRGAHIGVGAQLNAVALEHKNFQARVGLNVATQAGVSLTDVTASVVGVGFNGGLNGFGISTPLGSLNFKPW
jgi:hypothetical protein